jgi:uncharacterized protein YebE (UPF0316 family)
MSPVLGALFIFVMRVTDMSLDTLRMLFTVRGRKLLAGVIGVVQATVFIVAVSQVLRGPLTAWNVLGYALGFGSGVVLGIAIEERLAIGFSMLRVFSPQCGKEIAQALRGAGYAVTEIMAEGRTGMYPVVNCAVARRDMAAVRELIDKIDPQSFVTADPVQNMRHGYFRH